MNQLSTLKNLNFRQNFGISNLPDLDIAVLAALELFSQTKITKINIPYKRPLVVGSGNAAATGRIIFENCDAVFADESSYEQKLKNIKAIDGIVLISASGGKHAPIIAKKAKKYHKHITLITNNSQALAKIYLDHKHDYDLYVLPKNREPYTYNTSTYLGMILAYTKEDPQEILAFIKQNIDKIKLPNFKKYNKYYFIVPEQFEGIIRMLNVKFMELFGRRIAKDIEPFEYVKHATTIVPSDRELFINFGQKNKIWGKNRLSIPLPKKANYAAMMAISYYVIGKIQRTHPPWFKKNIVNYCKLASKQFKQEIKPIVD